MLKYVCLNKANNRYPNWGVYFIPSNTGGAVRSAAIAHFSSGNSPNKTHNLFSISHLELPEAVYPASQRYERGGDHYNDKPAASTGQHHYNDRSE